MSLDDGRFDMYIGVDENSMGLFDFYSYCDSIGILKGYASTLLEVVKHGHVMGQILGLCFHETFETDNTILYRRDNCPIH